MSITYVSDEEAAVQFCCGHESVLFPAVVVAVCRYICPCAARHKVGHFLSRPVSKPRRALPHFCRITTSMFVFAGFMAQHFKNRLFVRENEEGVVGVIRGADILKLMFVEIRQKMGRLD